MKKDESAYPAFALVRIDDFQDEADTADKITVKAVIRERSLAGYSLLVTEGRARQKEDITRA